jgi:glycosyl transferase, family 25
MSTPVYLINLSTSPERLEKSKKRLAEQNINYIRVEGILGKELSNQEINQHYSEELNRAKYHTALTKGQIGCYLSHRKVWQLIADGDNDFAIILEDDFVLSGDLVGAISSFEQPLNEDFNIVVHAKPMSGGAATALTKKAAKKLLAATSKFGRPCDSDIQCFWETNVKVLSLMPYPVAQDMALESTISAKKEPRKKYFWRRKVQQFKASRKNKVAVKAQIEQLKTQLEQ